MYRAHEDKATLILDFDARCRWVVSFTLWLCYLQSLFGCDCEEKTSALAWHQTPSHPACSQSQTTKETFYYSIISKLVINSIWWVTGALRNYCKGALLEKRFKFFIFSFWGPSPYSVNYTVYHQNNAPWLDKPLNAYLCHMIVINSCMMLSHVLHSSVSISVGIITLIIPTFYIQIQDILLGGKWIKNMASCIRINVDTMSNLKPSNILDDLCSKKKCVYKTDHKYIRLELLLL